MWLAIKLIPLDTKTAFCLIADLGVIGMKWYLQFETSKLPTLDNNVQSYG